jgi:hypothetical protein
MVDSNFGSNGLEPANNNTELVDEMGRDRHVGVDVGNFRLALPEPKATVSKTNLVSSAFVKGTESDPGNTGKTDGYGEPTSRSKRLRFSLAIDPSSQDSRTVTKQTGLLETLFFGQRPHVDA